MAFTSNINTAVERAQAQVQSEQAARESQERQITATAAERLKGRQFQERLYNIRAGDAFTLQNPLEEITDSQKDSLGEDVFNVHSDAVKSIREGSKLISSGNTQDRIKGQQMVTAANKSIKELKLEYEILEEDTQAYLTENNLDSNSNTQVQAIAEAFTDGRVKIVSGEKVGDKGRGRWIQYENEETGELSHVSFKDYQRMLKNGVKRVDVAAWVKKVGDVLDVDKTTRPDGTSDTRLRSPEAVDAHIDDLLSDDKIVNALLQQFDISTPDKNLSVAERQSQDLNKLRSRLTDNLKASKGITVDREKTVIKPPKPTAADRAIGGLSHRHWQVLQASQTDNVAAAQFLLGELKGTSPIKGVGTGDQVKDVKIDTGSNIITLSFEGEAPPLKIPWKQGAINDLFNSFATNINEQKFNIADVFATTAQQAISGVPDIKRGIKAQSNRDAITRLVSNFTDKDSGLVSTKNLVNSIREGTQFGDVLGKAEVRNKTAFFSDNEVEFFGTRYNLNEAQGLNDFIDAFASKVGEGENNLPDITELPDF